MLATSNDQKIFLEAFDFSSLRETGLNILDAVEQSITIAKERYDASISSVLTDNAYNMTNMGNAAAKTLNLLYSTCNAHSGNLLAGDIIKKPPNGAIMAKVMKVQKAFKKTKLEVLLQEAGGQKPVLYCATRWTSQRGAAESFLKNLTAMKKVAAENVVEEEPDEEDTMQPNEKTVKSKEKATPSATVSQLLYDEKFLESVRKLVGSPVHRK